ncbi:MAG: tetratricopeptide repeat protein [Clostridia bacterium]|nr:tetratricopeptide repeat protein [Clostridia bacterium]
MSSNNNVLSFKQPAEFYIKKAEKHIDAGNFLEALQLYRNLVGMEPDNVEYLLYIAQIYSEIGLFNESNDMIHKIMRQGHTPTECLFALGCNYLGLNKFETADSYFMEYLKNDPEGEFAQDIEEIWESYYEDEERELLRVLDYEGIAKNISKGKELLDKCEYKQAIVCFEAVLEQAPLMHHAANNLALCYYFDGNLNGAIATSNKVLEHRPRNIHAHCNLAMFYYKTCSPKLTVHLNALENAKDLEPHDMHKVALTYCELNYHDKAYKWFVNILSFQPYDVRILHFCGLAAYNYGLYGKALECFIRILQIDPGNSVAAYYKKLSQDAKETGGAKTLEYVYQVPFVEIKRRMKYLRESLKEKDASLTQKWNNDAFFVSILLWGLNHGDDYIKKIALEIISVFADKRAEEIFRDFILKSTESDELKNDVFLYLNNMNAQEPYIALIKGDFAEVRIDTAASKVNKLDDIYIETINHFMRSSVGRLSEPAITAGVELFIAFAGKIGDEGKWIKRPQALAAAIELAVRESHSGEKHSSKTDIARIYKTTIGTINKYYDILSKHSLTGGEQSD